MKGCLSQASGFSLRLFLLQRILLVLSLFIFFFTITTCASSVKKGDAENQFIVDKQWSIPEWTELVPAIDYYRYQNSDTMQSLIYHLVRVQLDNPLISIGATKPIEINSSEMIGQRTKNYVQKSGAFLAVNTSPFTYPLSIFSKKRAISGLYVYEGVLASPAKKAYAALCFTKDKQAFILNSQTESLDNDVWFAFGGFWTILDEGIIYEFKNIQEARTAIGIGSDSYTLYILSVEKNKKSKGLSFMDCAQILQQAGAQSAVQLDGGGSTSLVFQDYPQYSVFSSRKVASNFGIFYQ